MARLRPIKSVRVLTVEEKTRVANLFMLLVEIDLQTGVTNKRRSPKTAKAKIVECCCYQQTQHRPSLCQGFDRQAIKKEHCSILCKYNKASRMSNPSRTARRDLFLKPFVRIFKGNVFNFIMGYSNDRYYCVNTPSGIIHYHQS
jgi:hypothetical protein